MLGREGEGEMTVGEQLEYQKLNTEIQDSDKRQMEILGFVFTVSLAILGYGLARGNALVLLLPLLVIGPGQVMIVGRFQMTRRMASYIRCFLEVNAESPRYETRTLEFRRLPRRSYRSLIYGSQFAFVQLLAVACLGLSVWTGSTTTRWLAIAVAAMWIGFAFHTKRLYDYFKSGGAAEDDYFEDWRRVRDLETQPQNGPTADTAMRGQGGDAR